MMKRYSLFGLLFLSSVAATDNNNNNNDTATSRQTPTRRGSVDSNTQNVRQPSDDANVVVVNYEEVYDKFMDSIKGSKAKTFLWTHVGLVGCDLYGSNKNANLAEDAKAMHGYNQSNLFFKGFGCVLGGLCSLFDKIAKPFGFAGFKGLSVAYWKGNTENIVDFAMEDASVLGVLLSILATIYVSIMGGVGILWGGLYVLCSAVMSVLCAVLSLFIMGLFYAAGYYYTGLVVSMLVGSIVSYFVFSYLFRAINRHRTSNIEWMVSHERSWYQRLLGKQEVSWYMWMSEHYVLSTLIGVASLAGVGAIGYGCYNLGLKKTIGAS